MISSEKMAQQYLYNFYLQHKFLINIIYLLGGLTLIGIFSFLIYIKSKKKKNITQFDEVELK